MLVVQPLLILNIACDYFKLLVKAVSVVTGQGPVKDCPCQSGGREGPGAVPWRGTQEGHPCRGQA